MEYSNIILAYILLFFIVKDGIKRFKLRVYNKYIINTVPKINGMVDNYKINQKTAIFMIYELNHRKFDFVNNWIDIGERPTSVIMLRTFVEETYRL